MIKMIRGTYGLRENGAVVAKTKRSAPFSLAKAEEKRLVDAGVAVFVDEEKPQDKTPAQKGKKAAPPADNTPPEGDGGELP